MDQDKTEVKTMDVKERRKEDVRVAEHKQNEKSFPPDFDVAALQKLRKNADY